MTYLKKEHFNSILLDEYGFVSPYNYDRISSKAMYFFNDSMTMSGIVYVNTVVAIKEYSNITLQTGGRYTNTTKKHIRKFIRKFGFDLYQKDFQRYIKTPNNETLKFTEKMVLSLNPSN